MKKLTYLLLCVLLTLPSLAQFDKLSKSFNKAKNDLNRTTKELRQTKEEVQRTSNEVKQTTGSVRSQSSDNQQSSSTSSSGKDYYISSNGKGREATKTQPAKELGVVIPQLQAGDRVHIAAGTYLGMTERGSDVIDVPVSIIGGYSPDFDTRDPWGKYRTVLSGTNEYMKESTERIGILSDKKARDWNGEIVIDGLIVDNAPRNRYVEKKGLYIRRKADEATNENPTPNTPGIKIRVGANTRVIVRNCLIVNTAPTQGALDVQIGKNGTALIENNAIINNTGEGIMCKSLHQGSEGIPQYTIRHNTILFCWKHDEIASFGGNCLMMDGNTVVVAEDNVFGFGDFGGVNNVKQCKSLSLRNNLFVGHKKYDYKEYNTMMKLDDMADYGQYLKNSDGNITAPIQIPVDKKWAELYTTRKDVNRGELEANVKVSNGKWNQVRGMLGLPLQGSSVGSQAEVWLHRMSLEDALRAAQSYQKRGVENRTTTY